MTKACVHACRCGGDAWVHTAAAGQQQPRTLGRGAGPRGTRPLQMPHCCGAAYQQTVKP